MKVPGKGGTRTASINLTPMIDVVFLLIIFFIVSGTMMQQETSRPVLLPAAAGGEEIENKTTGKLVISADTDGTLHIGQETIPFDALKTRILREKSLSSRPLEVRIRADRNLPWQKMEPILILCAETEIEDLSFSVLPK